MIHPLPVEKIRAFATERGESSIVVEELDDIIEAHCRTHRRHERHRQGAVPAASASFSQNYIAGKLGMARRTPAASLDESHPGPAAGHVRGLPAQRACSIRCQEEQADRPRRYRLLYAWRCCAARRDRHDASAWARPSPACTASTRPRGEENANKSVAVIGDSTFMHSGITGLHQHCLQRSRTRPSSCSITPSPA